MYPLNKWIILQLNNYLDNIELKNLILTNKQLFDKDDIIVQINKNKSYVKPYFYHLRLNSSVLRSFKDTFFPERLISSLPQFYPIHPHHVGATDYIDRVRATDMTHPIMIGCDQYNRPYISIMYHCNESTYKNWNDDECNWKNNTTVLTCFQRYSNGSTWCKAGSGTYSTYPLLYGTNTYLNSDEKPLLVKNILRLLCNEKIEVRFPRGWNDEFETEYIDCTLGSRKYKK